MNALLSILMVSLLTAMSPAFADNTVDESESPGVLDRPLPPSTNGPETATVVTSLDPGAPVSPEIAEQNLRDEYELEHEELEQLPNQELELKAEQGERAAQIVLAESFAREAEGLAFAPVAANDALSDAVRWYSLAASRGFPGAPSLDKAGVQFYPIRVQRSQP